MWSNCSILIYSNFLIVWRLGYCFISSSTNDSIFEYVYQFFITKKFISLWSILPQLDSTMCLCITIVIYNSLISKKFKVSLRESCGKILIAYRKNRRIFHLLDCLKDLKKYRYKLFVPNYRLCIQTEKNQNSLEIQVFLRKFQQVIQNRKWPFETENWNKWKINKQTLFIPVKNRH